MKIIGLIVMLLFLLGAGCPEVPSKKIDQSWSDEEKMSVTKGEITIGMTEEQVIASWGKPWSKVKSIEAGRTIEVWEYGLGKYAVKHLLVFDNGKLARIVKR